jgi:anti-sigma factor RsiW
VPPTIEERELTCKELVELVTEYLEGKLSMGDQKRFSEHLALCDGCQAYLQQMRVTMATLGRLTEESISEKAKERLLRAFRSWKD